MKRLIVTIPAYNEEETIGKVIAKIPRKISGVDEVSVLVFDDGSIDNTVKIAKSAGADIVISHYPNRGLAETFKKALHAALKEGADIIVNIDADDQYDPNEIEKLIHPILSEEADMVSGNRQVEQLTHMPLSKKVGNRIGSWMLRGMLKNNVQDASSGFRAFSRECALRLNIMSSHTYTHETIIQCTMQQMSIVEMPVNFGSRVGGESKLISNIFTHIAKSLNTIARTYLTYKPVETLYIVALTFFFSGLFLLLRYVFLVYVMDNPGSGRIQSVSLGGTLVLIGALVFVLMFFADLIAVNRRMNEELLYRARKNDFQNSNNL